MKPNRIRTLIIGAALGAGVMYLLDPGGGRRRRALVRDKGVRAARVAGAAVGRSARDMAHRTRGVTAGVTGRWRRRPATDEVVAARVRSMLGRTVSHPHALEVTAHDGRVRLAGPVLAQEVDALLNKVRAVRGVLDVANDLEVHDSPENTPALQGGRIHVEEADWRSLAKIVVGVGSAVALGAGLAKAGSGATTAGRS